MADHSRKLPPVVPPLSSCQLKEIKKRIDHLDNLFAPVRNAAKKYSENLPKIQFKPPPFLKELKKHSVPTMGESIDWFGESAPTIAMPEPKLATRGRRPNKFKATRWNIIQQVFKKHPDIKGRVFWERVEAKDGVPDPDWRAYGCPKKLTDAYDNPTWRHKLDQDKSRATSKLRK